MKYLLAFVLLFTCGRLAAQYSKLKCISGNCEDGSGCALFIHDAKDTSLYTGQFKDGKMAGEGILSTKHAYTTGQFNENGLPPGYSVRFASVTVNGLNLPDSNAWVSFVKEEKDGSEKMIQVHEDGQQGFYHREGRGKHKENFKPYHPFHDRWIEEHVAAYLDKRASGPRYSIKKCVSGDCENGVGQAVMNDRYSRGSRSAYNGHFKHGQMSGFGSLSDGNYFYRGNFENNDYKGYGTLFSSTKLVKGVYQPDSAGSVTFCKRESDGSYQGILVYYDGTHQFNSVEGRRGHNENFSNIQAFQDEWVDRKLKEYLNARADIFAKIQAAKPKREPEPAGYTQPHSNTRRSYGAASEGITFKRTCGACSGTGRIHHTVSGSKYMSYETCGTCHGAGVL